MLNDLITANGNRRIVCREFGDPQRVLQLERANLMPIRPDQIRVQLRLAPINPSDLIPVWGNYSHRIGLPFVTGYEGVGTVIEVGAGVSAGLVGKRVLPLRGEGTWQQTILSPAAFAVAVPDWLDDIAAAQLYINPLTAWVICRHRFAVRPGETVVINAAGSAIGRIFAQLAPILGFRVIAVVRNMAYRRLLLELGATAVIEESVGVADEVRQQTHGKGADYAIDLVGAESGTRLAFSLTTQGRFMALGLFSGQQANWADIARQLTVQSELFHLRQWNLKVTPQQWRHEINRLIELIGGGRLTLSPPGELFKLADVKRAIGAATASGRLNKAFLVGEGYRA